MDKDHYGKLDEREIELEERKGFFDIPEQTVGRTDYGPRKFLMIYFDDEESYQIVLDRLQIKNAKVRCHPAIDTAKLVELCREV